MRLVQVGDAAPDVEVQDTQGQVVRLSSLWTDRPALLFFLRHLGCPCTREQAEHIRQDLPRFHAAGAYVAAITLGPTEVAAKLFGPTEQPITVLVDPNQQAYRAYGLGQGTLWQLAGPLVWGRSLKALLQGRVGKPAGDVRQLPGTFLVDSQGVIQYIHRAAHSADFPDHRAILARLAALAQSTPP